MENRYFRRKMLKTISLFLAPKLLKSVILAAKKVEKTLKTVILSAKKFKNRYFRRQKLKKTLFVAPKR